MKVLLVDDDASLRKVLSEILRAERYDVVEAATRPRWMQRGSRCAICRRSFVRRLHAFGVAPREFLTECQFDADLDLRADARHSLTE